MIDISHHNGTIDWDKVAAQQPIGVFLKATERCWTDPTFDKHRQACEDRGILWMPYIFLRPDDSDTTFKYAISQIANKDVPVWLDWEQPDPAYPVVKALVVERWIDALRQEGYRPCAYYGYWPPDTATEKIGECPRWFPQYTNGVPRLPAWDGSTSDWRKCWLVWQYSENGSCDGINGNVDLNRFAVTRDVFAHWYKTGELPQAQPAAPVNKDKVLDLVGRLQKALADAGYYHGQIDQNFGPASYAALRAFTEQH